MFDITVTINGIEQLLVEEKQDVYRHVLLSMERALFTAAMKHYKGNLTRLSAAMGLSRFTVRRKLAELRLRAEDFSSNGPDLKSTP